MDYVCGQLNTFQNNPSEYLPRLDLTLITKTARRNVYNKGRTEEQSSSTPSPVAEHREDLQKPEARVHSTASK